MHLRSAAGWIIGNKANGPQISIFVDHDAASHRRSVLLDRS
jgi:hypothetical protein